MPCSWRCLRGKDAEVMPLAVCCQTLVLCRLLWECCKGARWFCSWAKRWKRGPMAAAGSWKSYFHTGQGIFSPDTTTDISAQTLDKDDDGVSCTTYTHTSWVSFTPTFRSARNRDADIPTLQCWLLLHPDFLQKQRRARKMKVREDVKSNCYRHVYLISCVMLGWFELSINQLHTVSRGAWQTPHFLQCPAGKQQIDAASTFGQLLNDPEHVLPECLRLVSFPLSPLSTVGPSPCWCWHPCWNTVTASCCCNASVCLPQGLSSAL